MSREPGETWCFIALWTGAQSVKLPANYDLTSSLTVHVRLRTICVGNTMKPRSGIGMQ